MKRKLTKVVADKAAYTGSSGSRCMIWDTEIAGFGLRVYPTGRKSFVLSYRVQGRKRLMKLGDFGVLTVTQARRKARAKLVNIDDGTDPLQVRRDAEDADTVQELFDVYVRRHAKRHKKTWREDERQLSKHTPSSWLDRSAVSLTRNEVAKVHQNIGDTRPYAANRYVEILRRAFNLAEDWGVVPNGHRNPAARIKKHKEESRDRFVTHQEMPKLAKAIDAEPNIYNRSALWGYLLTGMRKSELLGLKWSDIDLHERTIAIRDTKAGNDHHLPLTQEAVELFESVPRMQGNPYVFCGRDRGKPIRNINKPWSRVRKVAGLDDVRLHDLRRTVGSWMVQAGHSLHLVGSVLNHKSPKTTAVYARFQQQQIETALSQHSKSLRRIAEGDSADVVELQRSAKGN